jgi:hypothetical protein
MHERSRSFEADSAACRKTHRCDWVIAELVLAEQSIARRRSALTWGHQPRLDFLESTPRSAENSTINPLVLSSFLRMTVGSRGMFVRELAMFVRRGCVLLRVFVLAEIVMMGRLMVMLTRRVLR